MKIFTISNGKVSEGADVVSFRLEGAGITIPAILVGEQGRGRALGVLPVELSSQQREEWLKNGSVKIYTAKISQTKSGKPKLISSVQQEGVDENIICVLRTHIGFRGSNCHTGDRLDEFWVLSSVYHETALQAGIPIKDMYSTEEVRQYTPSLMREFAKRIGFYHSADVSAGDTLFERKINFAPFPGEIISEGIIAQGDAGAMGSGKQIVAIIPQGVVFRTGYKGRLYGAPSAHYYIFKGGKLLSATWEEREITDIF